MTEENGGGDVAQSLDVKDLLGKKSTINFLILRQMDRLNYVLSQSLARGDNPITNQQRIVPAVKYALYSIEAMLVHQLSDAYPERANRWKEEIDVAKNSKQALNACIQWYNVLVIELPHQILPRNEAVLEFEE